MVGGDVKRVEIESKLNDSRSSLLVRYADLTDEQLRRPLTPSQHDPGNLWNALDHLGHLAFIETSFQRMIHRHLAGHPNPVALRVDESGVTRTREEIIARVNAQTEAFQREHHDDSFSDIVAITAAARGATLQLLSELSDDQLEEQLEGAPWGDGTLGGVLGANAGHASTHWKWITDAGLLAVEPPNGD